MECDGEDREGLLEEDGVPHEWANTGPLSLGAFIAPVLEATEITARTLEAMRQLFDTFKKLQVHPTESGWKPIVKVTEGFAACKAFLQALARASDLLGIRPQSRAYRNQFTKNYKALFPDYRRHYRVDVLEASQEGYSTIYVNGERYDFHATVLERGASFREAWGRTLDVLNTMQHVDLFESPFWRSELVPVLVELDSKWASFEEEYILELIQIERKARRYVMDVIYLENQLLYLDGAVASLVSQGNANQTAHLHVWQQWQSCRRQYVKKVFRLNSVANYRRKGHTGLDLSVLEASENIIKTSESDPGHVYSAVEHMAAECVTSFNDFRGHINELRQSPERVDPHLGNNHVLVSHLCRLEETWQLAHKYLRDPQRLRDLLSLIEFITAIVATEKTIHLRTASHGDLPTSGCPESYQRTLNSCRTGHQQQSGKESSESSSLSSSHPSSKSIQHHDSRFATSNSTEGDFADTLEHRVVNCDVGAFLAIPRFVCLYYLLDPIHRVHLFRPFLPSLFREDCADGVNVGDVGDNDCSSTPTTPASLPRAVQEGDRCTAAASVLSGAQFVCRLETRVRSPVALASPQVVGSKVGDGASDGPVSSPATEQTQPEGAAFPQHAEASEETWANKRQQNAQDRGEVQRATFPSAPTTSSTTQGELAPLSGTHSNSLLPLFLSGGLLDTGSATSAEGNLQTNSLGVPSAPASRSGPSSQRLSCPSLAGTERCVSRRLRVFPCHSDSDWCSTVPPPFCGVEAMGSYRCCRLVRSKVPRSLRPMVRAWQKIQQWVQTAGMEGRAEPWLCVVARLSDSGAFEPLMHSQMNSKVSGGRRYLEALFQSVESVSMAIQRSCAAEWNEFLQVLITSVTHRMQTMCHVAQCPAVSQLSTDELGGSADTAASDTFLASAKR
ncbi:phospho-2-dehydro-3-deoxyheptonate protein [Cyclospora cayetanensis]|uniref:Phospho-2-dehydro-3-deoxyheptonate protein n=1 Tax=Cyclospora cayetanensis TaxID=88456 RepID=A0A1D3CRX4_9EIME|nr:phospho-2-dehydro-3-deoxyheptonate protein [Cyclospora cayetanensis]